MHGDDQRVRGRWRGARHEAIVPRRRARTRALVGALVVACTAAPLRALAAELPPLDLVAPPPTIAPREVAAHRDEVVVLELEVARASAAPGRVVLEPAAGADDGPPVRVVLVPPLLGEPGARLATRYAGHRVRVLGRVREFGGAYEIFSTDPDAIVLLDGAPAAAVPGTRAAAPVPGVPVAMPDAGASQATARCAAARDGWHAAAAAARPALAGLSGCLAGTPGCGDALRAAQAALAAVAAAEEDVRWRCGGGT